MNLTNTYFIGDLHFGHRNILAYDDRPFTSILEHDNCLIELWNKTVQADDDVYILGDFSFHSTKRTSEIINSLNGKLHLIIGNHDRAIIESALKEVFVEVCYYKRLDFLYLNKSTSLVLCHYPIPCFDKHYYGGYHFYAHVHNSFEENIMRNVHRQMEELYDCPCNMFNVGAMMPGIMYEPKTFEEIIEYKGDVSIKGGKIHG